MVSHTLPSVVAVVEDDAVSRTTLGRVLRIGGFEPELFDSAEAFIADAASRKLLCLILDLHLGGMSGIDLQRKLRRDGSTLPIIITTANREESVKARAEHGGCRAVLWKPFDVQFLLTLLDTIAHESSD
jgi:FixJ family two-component response regulator